VQDSCNFSFSGLKTSVAKLISDEQARLGGDLSSVTQPGSTNTTANNVASNAGDQGVTPAGQAGPASVSAAADQAAGAEKENDAQQAGDSKAQELRQSAADIAASFQRVAVAFLQQRTRRALQWLKVRAVHLCAIPSVIRV
jgi:tRNA A37 threonylcarbamoyltransferase TsaD